MMWIEDRSRQTQQHRDATSTANANLDADPDEGDYSLDSSTSSNGEELPIWVRGEQRWVSGIADDTTCRHVIEVLLQDERNRGKHVGNADQYQVTERWRGVEQPLDNDASVLQIWTAWGTAQKEVKMSLRRTKSDRTSTNRRVRHYHNQQQHQKSAENGSVRSDRSAAFKTVHPKRIDALQNEKQPSSTEELLKLVLAQGEVIRKQLKKLRNNENQIGALEDKTHRARVRKHGSNYLLETYLKGLPEAVEPAITDTTAGECCTVTDKNSDSGVVTEGDSDQNKPSCSAESSFERFSPSSQEHFNKDLKDDDTSSTVSETTVREQLDLFEKLAKLNKRLLREEETLVRLHASLRKYDKNKDAEKTAAAANAAATVTAPATDDITKALTALRTEMAKGSCELQHNDVVLEETSEAIGSGRSTLDVLYRDLGNEDREFEMLQTLLYTHSLKEAAAHIYTGQPKTTTMTPYRTKETLDTLV